MPGEVEDKLSLPIERILSFPAACETVRIAREKGLVVVLATGVFDILHAGHLDYLDAARQVGDLLMVGLENDGMVRLNKGDTRPFFSLDARLRMIASLRTVDYAFGFEDLLRYGENIDGFVQRYSALSPNRIAISGFDPNRDLKMWQCQLTEVELVVLKDGSKSGSSSKVAHLLGWE